MTFEEIVLADQQEFQNETCCVIEEPQDWNGFAIMTYKEIKRTDTQNPVLYTGTYDECKSFISRSIAAQELVDSANKEHDLYFIKDETWPSRRWNKDMTDYIDLSGDEQLYEQEQLKEIYTREEVYLVAQRSVHAVINNLLTDNRTRTMKQVIDSEIDTVKLF